MATTLDDGLLLNLLKEIRSGQRDQRTLLLQSVDYALASSTASTRSTAA